MKPRAVLIAVFLLLAGGLLWSELSCKEPYAITVDVSPTGNRDYPYVATGNVVGCGIRRWEGEAQFRLMLRPGAAPGGMRSSLGRSVVSVRAGVSADARIGWYEVTVERDGEIVASKRAEKPLPVTSPQSPAPADTAAAR